MLVPLDLVTRVRSTTTIERLPMYHAVVRHKVRSTFGALSEGRWEVLTSQLGSPFSYRFVGDHAIGGTRTAVDDMSSWFERVTRLLPDLQFEVRDVVAGGPPWKTTVLTYVAVSSGDYRNELFQRATIRWGRLVDVVTMEDLQLLETYLRSLAADGVDEATAAPIVST
jgi:ketosteroid isomerase-like protein